MNLSNTPHLSRGAIIGLDKSEMLSATVFQYNPNKMTRSLSAKTSGGETNSGQSDTLRLTGAPTETINLEVEIDATDQTAFDLSSSVGIYPQLSALEILLYPKSEDVIADAALQKAGNFMVTPRPAPLTLLVWGAKRVLPVRITNFSVTEEAYDAQLNPIRATVNLSLEVLNYNTLQPKQSGYQLFMAYQMAKEVMAKAASLVGSSIF